MISSSTKVSTMIAAAGASSAQIKPVFEEDFESGKLDPAVWDQRVSLPGCVRVHEMLQTFRGGSSLSALEFFGTD